MEREQYNIKIQLNQGRIKGEYGRGRAEFSFMLNQCNVLDVIF